MVNLTNKKKVRGWNRRMKALRKWSKANALPSVNVLNSRGHDYVKLWIDPWYRLVRRNPPHWFFNLMLDELDVIYRHWDTFMQSNGEPYDLQIWITYPDLMGSQVVVDIMAKIGEERNNYFEKLPNQIIFPAQSYTGRQHFNSNNYTGSWRKIMTLCIKS
ncbi:hypothetical protein BH09BAC1_BH09BAC1_05300 [soil metagenome]